MNHSDGAGRVFLACVAVLFAACGTPDERRELDLTSTTSPIILGSPSTGDPSVVSLRSTYNPIHCTGVMISPRVVMTAGHCLIDWRSLELAVGFGLDAVTPDKVVPIVDARRHPEFTLAPVLERDLGLAILATPVDVPLRPIWGTLLDETIIGRELRLAGFGALSRNDDEGNQLLHEGKTIVESYDHDAIAYGASPSTTCHGDSGGPNFMTDDAGVEHVFAISSSGNSSCTRGWGTRLDIQLAGFIAPYLAQTQPGSAAPGAPCFFPEHCKTGACTPALDEPRRSFCSDTCTQDADCVDDMLCADELCRWPAPSPGTTGTECTRDEECISANCASPSAAEPGRCSERCRFEQQEDDVVETCASGACMDDALFPGKRRFCHQGEAAGCGCQGSGGVQLLASGLLLVATLRGRRRRAP